MASIGTFALALALLAAATRSFPVQHRSALAPAVRLGKKTALATVVRLPKEFQDEVDDKVSDLRDKVDEAKQELAAAEAELSEANAGNDGERKEKAQERLEKATLELALAELKLREELTKAINEQREKFAESIAKEVEEVVKEVEKALEEGGTPSFRQGQCKADFLDFSAAQLFTKAAYGGGVGECIVQVFPGETPLCYLYVKAAESTADIFGDRGFPKQTLPDGTLSGSGCVAGEDGPKGFEGCIYRNRAFQIDDEDIWRLCQKFNYFNAYQALLLALNVDKCALSC